MILDYLRYYTTEQGFTLTMHEYHAKRADENTFFDALEKHKMPCEFFYDENARNVTLEFLRRNSVSALVYETNDRGVVTFTAIWGGNRAEA